jgi:hypothetical protein
LLTLAGLTVAIEWSSMAKASRKSTPKARRRRRTKKAPAVEPPAIGAPASRKIHLLPANLTVGSPSVGVIMIVQAGPSLSIKTGRRRVLDSACVAQLQDQLWAHLRTPTSQMKQAAAVHLVRRWLQDSGKTPPSDQLIERQIVQPVYQRLWP